MDNRLHRLVRSAVDTFRERYREEPKWIVAAPGRVNLIGEHTDYNDGFVLPMAIDRYCVMAAGDTQGDIASFYSKAMDDEAVISLTSPHKHSTPGHWSNYVIGVIAGCMDRQIRPLGFRAIIETNVPYGAGLSSSASLEVATVLLIEAITRTTLVPVAKALLCQRAEHEYAGVPCGIMDQFASVMCQFNHLMLLDCRSQGTAQIPFVDPSVSILVINTNVKHALCGGEYSDRRRQCESAARKLGVSALRDVTLEQLNAQSSKLNPSELRRAIHVVSEIQRTVEAAAAIIAGDWPRLGQLMYASHESLRDDFQVSCRELDLLVEFARRLDQVGGVYGSRMTGGGFGGCTVSLVKSRSINEVANLLTTSYLTETGVHPGILISRPSRGAHTVDWPAAAPYNGEVLSDRQFIRRR